MGGPEDPRRELDERGWARLAGVLSDDRRCALAARLEELFGAEGARAGSEVRQEPGTRRLANLVDKGAVFVACILEPAVLDLVRHVLGLQFKLSSLNARAASPNGDVVQPLHVDGGALPDARGASVCNTLWML